jgi:hypothetical protein
MQDQCTMRGRAMEKDGRAENSDLGEDDGDGETENERGKQ